MRGWTIEVGTKGSAGSRSSRTLPSALFLLALAALSEAPRAQVGGHRHIAEEISGAGVLPASKLTPLLNKADGLWNHGEGFHADTGGVLSRSDSGQLGLGQPPDYQLLIGGAGTPMRSSVFVLKYQAGTNPVLQRVSQRPIGTPGTALPGYGACGLVVTNLDATPEKEVLVTTLNGELVVFPCNSSGILGTPLFHNVYEGSLGAYNSLLLEDRVAPVGKPERVYIAGSAGIRCFVVQ